MSKSILITVMAVIASVTAEPYYSLASLPYYGAQYSAYRSDLLPGGISAAYPTAYPATYPATYPASFPAALPAAVSAAVPATVPATLPASVPALNAALIRPEIASAYSYDYAVPNYAPLASYSYPYGYAIATDYTYKKR